MAQKTLRDKKINVRATDRDVAILKTLSERFEMSQSEIISLALAHLYSQRDNVISNKK